MDSLSDRLKSLGFKSASSLKSNNAEKKIPLEEAIQGRVEQNSLGEFVVKEICYPLDYQHGNVVLTNRVVTDTINRAAKIDTPDSPLETLLFIDTETSGLSGGAGTFAFLIGVGRFTREGFMLQQFLMRDPIEESAMLLHLINSINVDSGLVSFNGKSFDIPLLQNRLVLNKLSFNFRQLPHLDMLHISRKMWRRKLASCALKDLETAILDFERTTEDVPGWMIPDIYFEYLRNGDPTRLREVVYHNAQDILSLAALFILVTQMLEQNAANEKISVDDLIAISRVYWDMGSIDTSIFILHSTLERIRGREQTAMAYSMLGTHYKKLGVLTQAVMCWKEAALHGDANSAIELAMYYEHIVKDATTALEWCTICTEISGGATLNANSRFNRELIKRINRLQHKRSNNV